MKNLKIQFIVEEELKNDSKLQNEAIDVMVIDGTVTLNGIVSSTEIVQHAESFVYDIEGVDSVENFLVAREEVPVDEDKKIKNRLINQLSLKNSVRFPSLKIDVKDGIVSFRGSVDELWKKALLNDLALDTTGVRKVINNIQVSPSLRESDEELAAKIKNTIDKNYMIDSDKVHISVKKGIVRLSGQVRNPLALRAAINSATYTPGVKQIDNDLKVAPA